jgi:hypothetical protein
MMSSSRPAPDRLMLITAPSAGSSEAEFYLSDVDQLKEDGKKWAFSLHGNDKVFIAQFVYADEGAARRGVVGVATGLKGAVYVGPDEG